MRKSLLSLSLVSLSLAACVRAPERLGSVVLINSPEGFVVHKDNKNHLVEQDCLDTTLRKMNQNQRELYLSKGGALLLNQASNGEYTLKSVPNIKGGGPVMAAILYWTTKVCCYTGVAISATAVVAGAAASAVATGGATVAPTVAVGSFGAGLIVKGAITTAASTVAAPVTTIVLSGSAVTTAVGAATAGVTAAAGTAGATAVAATVAAANTGTVALAVGAAGKVGLAAGIEAASCNAFALGMLFPWF